MKLRILKLVTSLTAVGLLVTPISHVSAATPGTNTGTRSLRTAARVKTQGNPQALDRIIAIVNNGIILQSDLIRAVRNARIEMRDRDITPPPIKMLLVPVLNQLIMRNIQIQTAERIGIRITDGELNSAIQEIAKRNGLTTTAFVAKLSQSGISLSNVRSQIRDELMIARLREKVIEQSVHVTREDVDLLLANQVNTNNDIEYRLSYILIAVPENAANNKREDAKRKAEGLLKQLHNGANFAQMAIRYSDGAQALNGGDIGWRKTDDLPTMFAAVVPHLKPGQVSRLISNANGYYIVKVTGSRSAQSPHTATEVHLWQILLKPNALRNASATKALSERIYRELKKGASFAKLANRYSDDLNSKDEGGNMGWKPRQVYDSIFRHQLEQLAPGQISPPFHTNNGWYIVKLLGRRKRDLTKQLLRAKAREAILHQREQSVYESWLRQQRADSYVEVLLKPGMITKADLDGHKVTANAS